MDAARRDRIRALAEAHGLDPADLEGALLPDGLPDDLSRAVAEVLAETGRFADDAEDDGA